MHRKKRKYTANQQKTTPLEIHHHQELAVPCAKYKGKVKRAKLTNKRSVT